LKRKLAMVDGGDLTTEEKRLNRDMINFALTGERDMKQSVLDDIKAGEADISDMGGSY